MKNKKMMSMLLVVVLLISVVGIFFTTGVRGLPYSGEIFATDEDGGSMDNFLEGDHIYFTIQLDQNEAVTLTVTFRDADDTPMGSKTITTDGSGFYSSSSQQDYFDLTNRRAGTYYLRTSYEGDEIDRDYFEIHSNFASGSHINTWEDTDHTLETRYFVQGEPTYFSGTIQDARDEPLENRMITVRWMTEEGVYSEEDVWTDGEGYYEGSFDWGIWWMPDAPEPGDYLLEVVYGYMGMFEEQVVTSRDVEVYEQDFTYNSYMVTTEGDYETTKDFFTVGETVYYRIELMDQHGRTPAQNTMVRLYRQRDNEDEQWISTYNIGTDGYHTDWFHTPQDEGIYTLTVVDHMDDETVYASHSFTVISMDISIYPVRPIYTQGQTIEVRIESNYPEDIDIGITNSTVAPYRHMRDAHWEDQSLTNNMWTYDYDIPIDEADGQYYIVVNRSEDGEIINWLSFNIKRYSIEADTDKTVYLPGERVDVHYRVTNHLDGSEAAGVDVEWMVGYWDEDYNMETFEGSADHGSFDFQLPDDARINNLFYIMIWANDTAEGYEDELLLEKFVGRVSVEVNTDRYTYLQGQNVYIDLQTNARYYGTRSVAGTIDVELSLVRDGEEVPGFTSTITTDAFGQYSDYMSIPSDMDPGLYHIRANATWDEQWHVDEIVFEVVEETDRLVVHLERDKGVNSYYPGENVEVSYWITHADRIVNDANVRYRVYSQDGTYGYGFATGGSINFQVPTDFDPNLNLRLEVTATLDQDTQGSNMISIPVTIGRILLNPSEWNYRPGDEMSFEYELVGITDGDVDIVEYMVLDPNHDVIERGTPTDNSFDFTVSERPRQRYHVRVQIRTTDGYRISQTETISKITGFRLQVSVVTSSDHTTGVYRPGDEVTLNYRLIAEDEGPLPDYVEIEYQMGDLYGKFGTTETEGEFTIVIPEVQDGVHAININANGNIAFQTIEVEDSPSWMNRRIAGGLGVFNLLVIVLLMIALGMGAFAVYQLSSTGSKPSRKKDKKKEEELEDEEYYEEPSEYVIEDGEAEPDDMWSEGEAEPEGSWDEDSQIEPEDRDW